jgi:hypothetical protein
MIFQTYFSFMYFSKKQLREHLNPKKFEVFQKVTIKLDFYDSSKLFYLLQFYSFLIWKNHEPEKKYYYFILIFIFVPKKIR